MKLYQIVTEFRKGGSECSDIYKTREEAIEALKEEVGTEPDEFGGNPNEGTRYTTDRSCEVIEVSVKD